MKFIHTSDWHIGRALCGRTRYDEHAAFLDWLYECVVGEEADALLVAGDIFDSAMPSPRARELYYRFLGRLGESSCRLVVVTAGERDSAAFLDPPDDVQRHASVHVLGRASTAVADEALVMCDAAGMPELVVCAVPFIREREIQATMRGSGVTDYRQMLTEGIRRHYANVFAAVENERAGFAVAVPVIAMGHLHVAGGKAVDGDGVRDLYGGLPVRAEAALFPPSVDYVALGHLHVAQRIGETTTRCYSGAPIPLGFGDAEHGKVVLKVDFAGQSPTVTPIAVPRFRDVVQVKGDWAAIAAKLGALKAAGSRAWIEVVCTGEESGADLCGKVEREIAGGGMEVLRVENSRIFRALKSRTYSTEAVDFADVNSMFEQRLASRAVPDDQRERLLAAFGEVLASPATEIGAGK